MEDFEQEFVGWETVVVLTPAFREERQVLWELEDSLVYIESSRTMGYIDPVSEN